MSKIIISVINKSTVLKDADVQAYVVDQQTQIDRDFVPIWGCAATLVFVPKGQTPAKGTWQLVMLDTADQAGALGYHDLTPDNLPLAKVFAKDDLKYGYKWTVTASHEVFEMLVDPWINLTAFDNVSRFYAYEVCDAVEDDSFGYVVGKTLLSDFVTPAWFEPTSTQPGTLYSFRNHVSGPFKLAKGGYISFLDIRQPRKGWQQITAAEVPHVSGRLNRRRDKFAAINKRWWQKLF
jgi:hypothetical protein